MAAPAIISQIPPTGVPLLLNGDLNPPWRRFLETMWQRTGGFSASPYQPTDATLTALSALVVAADRLIYATGPDAFSTTVLTAFARTLLDDPDATTMQTTLGLGALALLSSVNDGNWSGTDLSVTNGGTGASTAANARTNLGLGTAAVQNTGTSGANVPLLNGANTWSGAQTPSAGLVGVATNSNAAAGQIGEFVSSTVLTGAAVSLTSATPANVTSISLTAGDWDVWGNVVFGPAVTTTMQSLAGWINTVSATEPTWPGDGSAARLTATFTAGTQQLLPAGSRRISLASTGTVYLGAQSSFGVSTMSAYGFIGARRVR